MENMTKSLKIVFAHLGCSFDFENLKRKIGVEVSLKIDDAAETCAAVSCACSNMRAKNAVQRNLIRVWSHPWVAKYFFCWGLHGCDWNVNPQLLLDLFKFCQFFVNTLEILQWICQTGVVMMGTMRCLMGLYKPQHWSLKTFAKVPWNGISLHETSEFGLLSLAGMLRKSKNSNVNGEEEWPGSQYRRGLSSGNFVHVLVSTSATLFTSHFDCRKIKVKICVSSWSILWINGVSFWVIISGYFFSVKVLPSYERQEMVIQDSHHALDDDVFGTHWGRKAMNNYIRRQYWFPGIAVRVQVHIDRCRVCQARYVWSIATRTPAALREGCPPLFRSTFFRSLSSRKEARKERQKNCEENTEQ